MIEELVEYIRSKDFGVEVFKGGLKVFKYVGNEIYQSNWMIDPVDVKYAYKEGLLALADHRMHQLNDAIATQEAP